MTADAALANDRLDLAELPSASFRDLVHRAVGTHPDAAARLLVGLSWSIANADELVEYLQRCVDLACAVVGGASSAGITVTLGGAPLTAVATDDGARDVVEREYRTGTGPCTEAMSSRQVVHVDLATVARRWPEVADAAEGVGVTAVLASPVGTDDECLGALNLLTTRPAGFSEDDAVVLHLLCRLAERSICHYSRLRANGDLVARLQAALQDRAPIEQAKGILMAMHRIDADDAFDRLTVEAQNSGTTLLAAARRFLAEHTGTASD